MKFLLSAILILFFFSSAHAAELYECNGSWTNVPCSEISEDKPKKAKLDEVELKKKKQRSRKDSLLHDLRMRQIRAKREYKIDISISEAADICNDDELSVKECRDAVSRTEDRLADRISAALLLAETKRANDLKEKQLGNQNNTVVIERPRERILIDSPDYRYRTREKTETSAGFRFSTKGTSGTISGEFSNTKTRRSGTRSVPGSNVVKPLEGNPPSLALPGSMNSRKVITTHSSSTTKKVKPKEEEEE